MSAISAAVNAPRLRARTRRVAALASPNVSVLVVLVKGLGLLN